MRRPGPARTIRRFLLTLLTAGALLATGAAPGRAQLPPLMSEEQERELGAQAHPQIIAQYGGIYDDPKLGGYVALIGGRLMAAADLPGESYTFSVLDSDVPNAFALPGGYVYVTRGLLALMNTEAELAGVMGHEIGHVVARHSARRQSGALFGQLLAGAAAVLSGSSDVAQIAGLIGQGALAQYSQKQEYAADELGIQYMRSAGWNPLAQADLLSSLKRQADLAEKIFGGGGNPLGDFFATHPNTLERVQRAVNTARQGPDPMPTEYGREAWLRHVDGLIFGGSPQNGYTRGRMFWHPELRFTFSVPAEWRMQNGATQVVAKGPDGVMAFDGAHKPGRDDPADYIRHDWLPEARLQSLEGGTVNGLPAAFATARGQRRDGAEVLVRMAAIRIAPGKFYRFQFVDESGRMGPAIEQSIRSFRRLSAAEADDVQPMRLRIFTVGRNDTVASLSSLMAVPDHKEEQFRVLNALEAGDALRPGDRVKIVVLDRPAN
jgi:predicted Zn-dependent protease